MNNVNLVGRTVKDAVIYKTKGDKSYTFIKLAVDGWNGKENKTQFISLKAWNKAAENIVNRVKKGSLISVEGEIRVNSYKKDDGSFVENNEIVIRKVEFLNLKGEKDDKPAIVSDTVAVDTTLWKD